MYLTFVPYFYHCCVSIYISTQTLKIMQSSIYCIADFAKT